MQTAPGSRTAARVTVLQILRRRTDDLTGCAITRWPLAFTVGHYYGLGQANLSRLASGLDCRYWSAFASKSMADPSAHKTQNLRAKLKTVTLLLPAWRCCDDVNDNSVSFTKCSLSCCYLSSSCNTAHNGEAAKHFLNALVNKAH